jgi:arsenate reductase
MLMQPMMKKMVLFLCTGNSCRSQMAEGLVNHYLSEEWMAFSAGTDPAGYVHLLAVQVMADLGIDISRQQSKSTDGFRDMGLELVITVCGDAARDCPVWLGTGSKVHAGFEDPARASGSKDERLAVFRRIRDEMRGRLFDVLAGGRWDHVQVPGNAGPDGLVERLCEPAEDL